MVVEGLMRNDIQELLNSDKLSSFIDDVSKRSATAKHWIDNLIKPIFICFLFVRAEYGLTCSLKLHLRGTGKVLEEL